MPSVFEKLAHWKLNIWKFRPASSVGLTDFCRYFVNSAELLWFVVNNKSA
jgi:hypothetical protein